MQLWIVDDSHNQGDPSSLRNIILDLISASKNFYKIEGPCDKLCLACMLDKDVLEEQAGESCQAEV